MKKIVVRLPIADYRALVRLARRTIKNRALWVDLPRRVVDRLCLEDPVRVLREFRGRTQIDLAKAARITQGHLSDIERGRRRGSMAVMLRLSDKLNVPIGLLT